MKKEIEIVCTWATEGKCKYAKDGKCTFDLPKLHFLKCSNGELKEI